MEYLIQELLVLILHFTENYVRDKNWMTLEDAVHKTTYLPAKRFNLKKRGLVRADFYADLFVFSADEIGTEATYLNPDTPSNGIYHVMVNGKWETV